jgi:hypothetical protein
VRTWAVWKRHKFIGIPLLLFFAPPTILDCIFAQSYLNSIEGAYSFSTLFDFLLDLLTQVAPSPFPGFRGCLVVKVSNIIFINYILLAFFDVGESTVLRAPGPILTILDSYANSYVRQCLENMYA